MVDFFIKKESKDEELAKKAHPHGDIDMIISPVDGKLVMVAQIFGVHVCASCLPASGPIDERHQFIDDPAHKQRPVEWNPPNGQGTRMLIHAGCIGKAKNQGGAVYNDLVRGHQAKRFLSRAMNGIKSIFGA